MIKKMFLFRSDRQIRTEGFKNNKPNLYVDYGG